MTSTLAFHLTFERSKRFVKRAIRAGCWLLLAVQFSERKDGGEGDKEKGKCWAKVREERLQWRMQALREVVVEDASLSVSIPEGLCPKNPSEKCCCLLRHRRERFEDLNKCQPRRVVWPWLTASWNGEERA